METANDESLKNDVLINKDLEEIEIFTRLIMNWRLSEAP